MKIRFIIAFFMLFLFNGVYGQKQILIAPNGVNATFEMEKVKHEGKEIVFLLTVKWVNEDLKPVEDLSSYLVLRKDFVKVTANQPVKFKEFKKTEEIRFQKQTLLHLEYKNDGIKDIKIELTPQYSMRSEGEVTAFSMAYPSVYRLNYERLVEPKIVITEPEPKSNTRGFRRLVENPSVKISGYVTSEYPVVKFTINRKPVQLTEIGEFEYSVSNLPKGENKFKITAIDDQGNQKTISLYLDYRPPLTEQDLSEVNYYALIIANNKYSDPMISDLDNPIRDATSLYNVLTTKYDFEPEQVMFLKNATNSEIVKAFDSLANSITSYDNLLIFYAGHGYWDENTEIGYWLPSDAEVSDKSTWFRNSTLRDYIGSINSNHTLLIADACFSGGIFKTRGAFDNASYAITKLYNMPSRKAMTSGTLKEVPDESVFLKYLIKRLEENTKTYISAASLFNSFREAVLNNSPNIPQYGVIRDSGDEGGEFIFIKKR